LSERTSATTPTAACSELNERVSQFVSAVESGRRPLLSPVIDRIKMLLRWRSERLLPDLVSRMRAILEQAGSSGNELLNLAAARWASC